MENDNDIYERATGILMFESAQTTDELRFEPIAIKIKRAACATIEALIETRGHVGSIFVRDPERRKIAARLLRDLRNHRI